MFILVRGWPGKTEIYVLKILQILIHLLIFVDKTRSLKTNDRKGENKYILINIRYLLIVLLVVFIYLFLVLIIDQNS